ncbi:hypothetical protein BBJ28_00020349 [Nothophytophthora sp. Chile5]|nr:hypothetical protein BBJ28_00020349 [Nothophytophthora sp. Chile5]
MTDMISRIAKTIYAVGSNAAMGELFAELCTMLDTNATTQLLEHKDHRFMGLTRVIRRLLQKWEELEVWFAERIEKALRQRKDPPEDFPLAEDRTTLLQLYALLDPITKLNTRSQSESANQVEVLLTLYRLRLGILDETKPLRDRFRSLDLPPHHFRVTELTPLVRKTRALLVVHFQKHFFQRYTDTSQFSDVSYIPEMQMVLHPVFKNLESGIARVARLCNSQLVIDPLNPHLRHTRAIVEENVAAVKMAVIQRVRKVMESLAKGEANNQQAFLDQPTVPVPAQAPTMYSEELMDMFGQPPERADIGGTQARRIEDEIERWLADPSSIGRNSDMKTESVLEYWQRQDGSNTYYFLPKVARIIFAVPASAAQIERDFGVSGMLVTSHRTRLAKHNIDMCSFLNRNREFVDITQCKPLDDNEQELAVPRSALVALDTPSVVLPFAEEWEQQMAASFSSASIDEETKYE